MTEQNFRGVCMIVGLSLASYVIYHFAGGRGVASLLACYCIWRAV